MSDVYEFAGMVTAIPTPSIPGRYLLAQNYPNPFNPATVIRFEIPVPRVVQLVVHDLLGREMARLVDGMVPAGMHSVEFNGSHLASGVYFCRMQAGSFMETVKLMLIR